MKKSQLRGAWWFTFILVIILQHLQMRHRQSHHLPQCQAEGEDVSLIGDLSPLLLQSLFRFPWLRSDVLRLWIRHWKRTVFSLETNPDCLGLVREPTYQPIPLFLKKLESTQPKSPESPSGRQRHHLDSWIITFHVLIKLQRHANVADLDALKVALDDNVTWLHVTVQQPLLVVKILRKQTKRPWFHHSSFPFLVKRSELMVYLKSTDYVQRHLFDVGSRKCLQAVLSPLLD